jgi:hypothetical protein
MNNQSNKKFFYRSKQVFSIILLGLCAALALETTSNAAKPVQTKKTLHHLPAPQKLEADNSVIKPVAKLEDWRFLPRSVQLEMVLSAASKPHYFYLAQPSRIVVDLPATQLGSVPTRQNYPGTIQSIRVSQLNTNVTRIVMDVAPGTVIDPKQVKLQPTSLHNPTHWVLRPFLTSYRTPLPPTKHTSKANYLLPTNNAAQPQTDQLSKTGSHNVPQPPTDQSLSKSNYNPSQSSNFSVLPPLTNFPPTQSSTQQIPTVSVPPLAPKNSAQLPNNFVLPPANLPTQPTNSNSANTVSTPDFPVPTLSKSPSASSNPSVINFGQPLPKSTR